MNRRKQRKPFNLLIISIINNPSKNIRASNNPPAYRTGRLWGVSGIFAWRYFKAKKSANAINIIAWVTAGVIGFATCCQVLVLSVFNGFEGLVKSLYSSFYTDFKIESAKEKTFLLTPAQLNKLKQQPFIENFSLIVEEKALLQNGEAQSIIFLKGVDENFSKVSGVPFKITRGEFNTGTADTAGIIVGGGIENAAAININDAFLPQTLTVILPKKTKSIDPQQSLSEGFIIPTGVFTIQQDFDNKYAITNIDFVKQQMGMDPNEFTGVEIKLKNSEAYKEYKEKLQQIMGNNYNVLTKYEQNKTLYSTMKTEKWVIYAVLTLILIIAAFNMVSSLTMLVLEKKQDIAIIQSMGGDPAFIKKIFLSSGLLLGGIGAASGILLAIIICLIQIKFKFIKLNGGSFLIDYFPVKLIFTDFLLVGATATAIALIASWVPAVKASKQMMNLK